MEIKDTFDFLLRAAIPEITENNKLPEELRLENGKKKVEDYASKKMVWECIYRAHRDVLTGRKNVSDYAAGGVLNPIALELYGMIINKAEDEELSSSALINDLLKEKRRIGPVQKLVNMTLKYMFLLQLFGKLKRYNIREEKCDCPLDSIILGSLGMGNVKWTMDFKIDDDKYETYDNIQDKIAKRQGNESKLLYDFKNWKSFPDED